MIEGREDIKIRNMHLSISFTGVSMSSMFLMVTYGIKYCHI